MSEMKDVQELLELENLEGVGEKTAEKMRAVGIHNIMDLAVASAPELKDLMTTASVEYCIQLILSANRYLAKHDFLNKELITSDDMFNNDLDLQKCSTGAKGLDELLGGGIETKAVTEFYGEFGKGKSQICFSAAVMATQPVESGGLDGNVLYIDTENTFSPNRIKEIAEAKGFDPVAVGKRIMVLKASNASLLTLFIKEIPRYVRDHNLKMVIVDSLIAPFRADFIGRGQLAPRQQILGTVLHKLVNVANIYKICVIFTNQVLSSPDMFSGGDKATGGNVVAHASTHRISLTKRGGNIIAKMEDSPRYPKIECCIELAKEGIKDKELGKKPKPKLEDILNDND